MMRTLFKSCALIILLWALGFIVFGSTLPTTTVPSSKETDAIVVLTGGNKRIEVALHLMEKHAAKKLFVSGVHKSVDHQKLLSLHPSVSISTSLIELGYSSNTTIENAREVRDWMDHHDFHSLRLVTSHYHMPRSLLEMKILLPKALITPHPVLSEKFSHLSWWQGKNREIVVNEYNKYLEALGRFVVNKVVSLI
ncbi:MAG: YdcF family protein [Alphaproteobacteria bacterium]|nr:YdcF family protein [Alphaproteobacteria bacterium]